jgi:hypothetical protein
MPLNFPINPTIGQTYAFSDLQWSWNGYAWNKLGETGFGGGGAQYLNDLLDVNLAGTTYDDILYFSGASSWINKPVDALNIDGGIF